MSRPASGAVRYVSARVNEFHVIGSVLAIWALAVSFTGIARERFPATRGMEIAVSAVSLVLAAAAIGAAVYTSAVEEEEGEDPAGPTALVR